LTGSKVVAVRSEILAGASEDVAEEKAKGADERSLGEV
jgi:hypothetical protein